MYWNLLIQMLIIGVATGSLIALIALGYTLVYGIVELINFAHGEVFMMGAFLTASIIGMIGVGKDDPVAQVIGVIVIAMILSMVFCALINAFIDRVAYKKLRNAPRLAPLIAAIGFSFILQNIGIYWKGPNPILPPAILPTKFTTYNIIKEWGIFGNLYEETRIRFMAKDLMVIGITIPLLIGMTWFVYKTRIGTAMRATAQDREAAALMGIDINRTIAVAFLLGGALAGAAGTIALLYNNSARFSMGFKYGLFAFTAAVLGGIGNLTGAVVGGILIGLIWAVSDGWLPMVLPVWGAQWTNTVIFSILVLVLVFKPAGLFGNATTEKV